MIGLSKPPQQKVQPSLQLGAEVSNASRFKSSQLNGLVLVSFLRHTGCPFAEQTFNELKELSSSQKSLDIYHDYPWRRKYL